MRRVRFLHWSYFLWTLVPLSLFAFVQTVGIPSFRWSYDWRALGPSSYSDFSQRHYTRCTYLGPDGAVTEYPVDGKCGWLRFPSRTEERP